MLVLVLQYVADITFFLSIFSVSVHHNYVSISVWSLSLFNNTNIFSFQEMYTQVGSQFNDELQRYHLPAFMVSS